MKFIIAYYLFWLALNYHAWYQIKNEPPMKYFKFITENRILKFISFAIPVWALFCMIVALAFVIMFTLLILALIPLLFLNEKENVK